MEVTVSVLDVSTQRTDCAVLPVFDGRKLSAAGDHADDLWGQPLRAVLRQGDLEGKPGEVLVVHAPGKATAKRVMLVGMGSARDLNAAVFRKAAAAMARAFSNLNASDVVIDLLEVEVKERDAAWKAQALTEAVLDAQYRFEAMKSSPGSKRKPPRRATLVAATRRTANATGGAVEQGQAISAGRSLARDLGNLPGNVCTPTYLASEARKLARGSSRLKTRVLTEKEIEKLGMGSFLAVAQGSDEPPRLLVMEYNGGDPERRPVVLVGKGVTFDSGGISLKPGAAMDEMKFDMCGAASVLGTLKALDTMAAPVNVVGLVVATENMPSGKAVKPGDIVTTMAGKTVEILNTDAEGRLILCDALTYAERFDPDVVIDMATLTGACMVALGNVPSGLFANHDGLAEALTSAGETTGDRVWRLPIWDDYQEQLNSNFADFANIGGRFGGAITAACFLARFAEAYRWAHLDIAGTAWHTGTNKGATGRPVGLLTEYILRHGAGRKRSGSARKRQ